MAEKAKPERTLTLEFQLEGLDFLRAGEASSEVKKRLKKLGFAPEVVRRAAIAAYEAEMNVIIHAQRGVMRIEISPLKVVIVVEDEGPGISDIELAMQEGYSTAPDQIREMGFGAGRGLPNIRRCADELDIQSRVGEGTCLKIVIYTDQGNKG